jgi:hypothetical protein
MKNEDSLRRYGYYFLIATVFLLVSVVLDSAITYDIETIKAFAPGFLLKAVIVSVLRDLAFAIYISIILTFLIERRHREQLEKKLDERVQAISEGVFAGVFQSEIPAAVVREAVDSAFKAKLFRRRFEITYSLSDAQVAMPNGGQRDYVCLHAVAEFSLKNISAEPTDAKLGVIVANPMRDELKPMVRVTEFRINNAIMDLQPGNQALQAELAQDRSFGHFSAAIVRLAPGEEVHVYASYEMAKAPDDTEVLRSVHPSESLTIRVIDRNGGQRKIRGQALHLADLEEITPQGGQGMHIWRINRALLPNQGVMFWWKSP